MNKTKFFVCIISIILLSLFIGCSFNQEEEQISYTSFETNESPEEVGTYDFVYEIRNDSSKKITTTVAYLEAKNNTDTSDFIYETDQIILNPGQAYIFKLDSQKLINMKASGNIGCTIDIQGKWKSWLWSAWKIENVKNLHLVATVSNNSSELGVTVSGRSYSLEFKYSGIEVVDVLDDQTNYTPEFAESDDYCFIYEIENKTSKTLFVKLECKETDKAAYIASKYLSIPSGKSYKFGFSEEKLDQLNEFSNNLYAVVNFRHEDSYEWGGWYFSISNAYMKSRKLTISNPVNSEELYHVEYIDSKLPEKFSDTVYEYNDAEIAIDINDAPVLGKTISKKGIDDVTVIYKPLTELYHIVYFLSDLNDVAYKQKETAKYKREVKEYFKDYMNMNVIKFCRNNRNFITEVYEMDIHNMLINFYEYKNYNSPSLQVGNNQNLDVLTFYKYLMAFAKESNFEVFFNQHEAYYTERSVQEGLDAYKNLKGWAVNFLKPSEKWNVSIYMHKGEWCSIQNLPPFSKSELTFNINLAAGRNGDCTGLAHELSHLYTNQIAERLYNDDVLKSKLDALYKTKEGMTITIHYQNTMSYLKDIMARACAGRYVMEKYGESTYKNYCSGQDEIGFAVVSGVAETLSKYENGSYKSLDDFYDEIYAFFSKALAEY